MCLSTAYRNKKSDDNIAARYVAEINVTPSSVILTDVMGDQIEIEGKLLYVDLTGGTVIIDTAA
jgi:predicted RNA-binding protein